MTSISPPLAVPPRDTAQIYAGDHIRILSWNLLHEVGAQVQDVVALIEAVKPDIVLMQEAVAGLSALTDRLGGYYARFALPERVHGLACWSRHPFSRAPVRCRLPSGLIVRRHAQIIDFGSFSIANVHLSHGQILNRRQLRHLVPMLRNQAIIMGDFNLVGPTLLPQFQDVGPRAPTHRMAEIFPIRIDRCLVRGMHLMTHQILPNFSSDHHPIFVKLGLDAPPRR